MAQSHRLGREALQQHRREGEVLNPPPAPGHSRHREGTTRAGAGPKPKEQRESQNPFAITSTCRGGTAGSWVLPGFVPSTQDPATLQEPGTPLACTASSSVWFTLSPDPVKDPVLLLSNILYCSPTPYLSYTFCPRDPDPWKISPSALTFKPAHTLHTNPPAHTHLPPKK